MLNILQSDNKMLGLEGFVYLCPTDFVYMHFSKYEAYPCFDHTRDRVFT